MSKRHTQGPDCPICWAPLERRSNLNFGDVMTNRCPPTREQVEWANRILEDFASKMKVEVDPSLPRGTIEMRDPRTGKVLGRIVNIGEPKK